jgi:hypothetical protein
MERIQARGFAALAATGIVLAPKAGAALAWGRGFAELARAAYLSPKVQMSAAAIVAGFAETQVGGPAVRVVTKLDSAPQAGRALSAAAGEGAEALAGAARARGAVFEASIPKAMLDQLEQAGHVEARVVSMGGEVGTEYRFTGEAMEILANWFRERSGKDIGAAGGP